MLSSQSKTSSAREGVVEGQHRHAVPHFFKTGGGRRADLSRRAFGQNELRKTRLDGGVALPERIILRVGDLGLILFVIQPVMVGDQFRQFLQFRPGVTLGQALYRFFK